MPHVVIKLYAGKTEQQKAALSQAVVDSLVNTIACNDNDVSLSFEEYSPEEWPEKVFRPDILECDETLYLQPGYNPFI